MFTFLVSLLSCVTVTVYGAGTSPQASFCQSQNVVRAELLPEGYIEKSGGGKSPFSISHWESVLELRIVEIFRTNRAIEKGEAKLHYAMGMNKDFNPDSVGCGFSDTGDEALFYFDDWDRIVLKEGCKSWKYSTAKYEKNALEKNLYDCQCDLSQCWDRLSRKSGEPECDHVMDQMLCRWDQGSRHGCIWKGARQTCVNPYSHIQKQKRRTRRK